MPVVSADLGAVDPELLALLMDAATASSRTQLLLALADARLLSPVVPNADGSEMMSVSFQAADGRSAALAFTGMEFLAQWRSDARPLSMRGADLAKDALERGLSALLVDLGQSHQLAVQGLELRIVAAN